MSFGNGFGVAGGVGPAGPSGAAGANGADGAAGATGATGAVGPSARWDVPDLHVFDLSPETISGMFGAFYRVDMSGAISGDVLTLELPEVTPSDIGKTVGLSEVTGSPIGGISNITLVMQPFAGQSIEGFSNYQLSDGAPRVTLIACRLSIGPDVYGWTFQNRFG